MIILEWAKYGGHALERGIQTHFLLFQHTCMHSHAYIRKCILYVCGTYHLQGSEVVKLEDQDSTDFMKSIAYLVEEKLGKVNNTPNSIQIHHHVVGYALTCYIPWSTPAATIASCSLLIQAYS